MTKRDGLGRRALSTAPNAFLALSLPDGPDSGGPRRGGRGRCPRRTISRAGGGTHRVCQKVIVSKVPPRPLGWGDV